MKPGAPTWVMQRAGILGNGNPGQPLDLLTPGARYDFIEEVINELQFGTPSLPFLCGSVPSTPLAQSIQDLHDETKYPDFHRNWVDTYELIAQGLNHPGSFMAAPLIDFTILIPDLNISLPDWSPDLSIRFPDWKIEFGVDLAIEIPKLSIEIPDISLDIPFPPEPLGINLPQLAFMFEAILKLPSIVIDLALSFIVKLPNFLPLPIKLPDLFLELCKVVREKIFPKDPTNEGVLDVTNAAAASVLARKTTELTVLSMLGMMVGSGPLVVGGVATAMGTKPADPEEIINPYRIETGIRGAVIRTAENVVGLHSSRAPSHRSIREEYAEFLFPNDNPEQRLGWVEDPSFSACGCFVRACYRRAAGGDIPESDPGSGRAQYVNLPYRNRIGNVINDLKQLARARGAVKYDLSRPALKKKLSQIEIEQGDVIFVSEVTSGGQASITLDSGRTHVLLTSYEENAPSGGRIIHGVQGGTPNLDRDPDGVGLGSLREGGQRFSLARITLYEQLDGRIKATGVATGNRTVVEIWDAEKLIRG